MPGPIDELLGFVSGQRGRISVGDLAEHFVGGLSDANRHLMEQVRVFGQHLGTNLLRRWPQNILQPRRCTMDNCEAIGVAPCRVCGEWTCLAHSHVSHTGDIVCNQCVRDMIEQRAKERRASSGGDAWQGAPKKGGGRMTPAQAFRVLDIKPGVSWDEVKKAWRKKAAQNHPDHEQDDKKRAKVEARAKRINEAFEVLKGVYQQKAA